jgi:hypothetical protein
MTAKDKEAKRKYDEEKARVQATTEQQEKGARDEKEKDARDKQVQDKKAQEKKLQEKKSRRRTSLESPPTPLWSQETGVRRQVVGLVAV